MHRLLRRVHAAITCAIVGAAVAVATDAHAQNNFTAAGEIVENVFTLDYSVGGVAQTQITNDGLGGNDAPTDFTVDRRVDVLVESLSDTNVVPSATGQTLVFRVRNDGNDNQAYELNTEFPGANVYDANTLTAVYFVDAGDDDTFTPGTDDSGSGTAITLGSGVTGDVAPDATIWVVVTANIPAVRTDTTALQNNDTGGVTLIADTHNPVSTINPALTAPVAGDETIAETGNDNEDGDAQNVMVDAAGPHTADNAGDGSHSDTGSYVITLADVVGNKTVDVIATDGADCGNFALAPDNTQFAIPGACIQYVITVTNNSATFAATDIDVRDTLPDEVAFVDAQASGFDVAGTLTEPAGTCTTGCEVRLQTLGVGTSSTGTLTIRATIR